jgi:hypothetical protein
VQPKLTFQAIEIMTGHADRQGQLVLADGQLIAVLVLLDDEIHGEDRGRWFLEAGFGPCQLPVQPAFSDLETAARWITERCHDFAVRDAP